jgi:predicted ATPase/class 3 adenylate cyclase
VSTWKLVDAVVASSRSVPTGTITFLFTDIEGSTKRWEAHREAMQAVLARHDEVMRAVFERHNGYVFKTIGDAFCVAFRLAPEALTAAVDAQRTLAKEDHSSVEGLRIRMGLHTGPADERDGDYFGPTVNRVARLMSIGHGGQILLSEATRALVHAEVPEDIQLHDLGPHRLKDLERPERVWVVTGADFPSDFPPLNSLDLLPNNLPQQLSSFYGREQELKEVKDLLKEHRLITLHGSGGIGKTRLALQSGADVLEEYHEGVWFADLSAVHWPEIVASVVSKALSVGQSENRSIEESIVTWLRRKNLLLILDNCEHVLDDAAKLTKVILEQCPKVSILVTSRQPLGLGGEQVVRLAPLGLPEPNAPIVAKDAAVYPALALFIDRALAVNKSFVLTDDDAFTITEICRHLDGLPLAIELAAARVKVLSVEGLAQRLDRRFSLLTGGSRSVLPHQRALASLIDWSYELLDEKEQRLFCKLAIFGGSFSLDAAEAVCSGDGIEDNEVLDVVASLVDKSLLVAETDGRTERYKLLESLRAYGWEKLKSREDPQQLAGRHANYYKRVALNADQAYGAKPDSVWLESVEPDVDNFRTALEWSLGAGKEAALGGIIAGCLERLWREGGLEAEGRTWISGAQAQCDESKDPHIAARLWRALAWLTSGKRSYEAAERACRLYERVGDGGGLARSLHVLAWGLCHIGEYDQAEAANDRALGWFKQHADKRQIAECLRQLANIVEARGDSSTARELHGQALALVKALGSQNNVANALANLGELEFKEGNTAEALRYVKEAIELASWGKSATDLAAYHMQSATYCIALGAPDAARSEALDGLHWAKRAQNETQILHAIQLLAFTTALGGGAERAARLVGFVGAKYKELDEPLDATGRWSWDKLSGSLRSQLVEIKLNALAAEGAAWSDDQAVDEALKS